MGEAEEQSVLPEAGLVLPPSLLPSSLPAFLSRSIRSRRRGAGGGRTDGGRDADDGLCLLRHRHRFASRKLIAWPGMGSKGIEGRE